MARDEIAQPSLKRFTCVVPGCGKLFNRKEHLTRHAKSHELEPQYQCPICERRYARSDVLRRHVTHHPQADKSWIKNKNIGRSTGVGQKAEVTPYDTELDTAALKDSAHQSSPKLFSHSTASTIPTTPVLGSVAFTDLNTTNPLPWIQNTTQSFFGSQMTTVDDIAAFLLPNLYECNLDSLNMLYTYTDSMDHQRFSNLEQPTELQMHLDTMIPSMEYLADAYFTKVHPYWPILHAPTFSVKNVSYILLGSIALLADWVDGSSQHGVLAGVMFEVLISIQPNSKFSLQTLQALLLYVVYSINCLHADGMLQRALHLNSTLISACRYFGIFSDRQLSSDFPKESAFAVWLAQEQLHRLAFAVLRADVYLSILMDHPPSVRYGELSIPLPKTARLWTATGEDERRRLQFDEPSGRETTIFCSLMHNALAEPCSGCPYSLNQDDYQLALCALQSGVWEAAREAHSLASDVLVTKLIAGNPMNIWQKHLDNWRSRMVMVCQPHHNYFSLLPGLVSSYTPTPLSLTLWHVSTLRMHAPLDLLSLPGNYRNRYHSGARSMHVLADARLHTWVTSGSSRIALWNAAQICRIVDREQSISSEPLARLLLNPIALPGVLMSAIVTVTWANHTQKCAQCVSGQDIADSVDLFETEEIDFSFVQWKATGELSAIWSSSKIPICQCQLSTLASWFRRLLVADKKAAIQFDTFLEQLRGLSNA